MNRLNDFFERAFSASACRHWLGLEPAAGRFFMLKTASLSALGYENNLSMPVTQFWDDTACVGD